MEENSVDSSQYGYFPDSQAESRVDFHDPITEQLSSTSSTKRRLETSIIKAKKARTSTPIAMRIKNLCVSYAKTFTMFKQEKKKDDEARIKKNERERFRRLAKKEAAKNPKPNLNIAEIESQFC